MDTMRTHVRETFALLSAATERAQTAEVRERSVPLVDWLMARHASGGDDAGRAWAENALGSSARLGMGIAEVEAAEGLAEPGWVDARIWNAVCVTMQTLEDFPPDWQAVLFYATQAGYFYGRTDDLEAL